MKHAPNTVPSIGLIGISGYGRVHLRLLEAAVARGAARFAGAVVIRRDEEREACERLIAAGVPLFDSWEAMLHSCRGQLDLCMIPVPILLHERLTVAALESGANVLVEKPLAASMAQARSIQEAERRTGKWVAVGYQDFYCPSVHAIHEDLAAGRIGTVRSINWLGLWPRPDAYFTRNNWAGKLSIAGAPVRDSPLNNAMAHFVNLSLFWAGTEPRRTAWPESVKAELFRCLPIESFDTAVMRVKTDAGVLIQAAVTHRCPVNHPIQMQILGDKGTLNWIHKSEAVWTTQERKNEKLDLETGDAALEAMFETVLARLRSSKARICTTDLALPQVACIEAIHESGGIHNIELTDLKTRQLAGSSGVIRNIENDLKNCLRCGALPSELGLRWAKPAAEVWPYPVMPEASML